MTVTFNENDTTVSHNKFYIKNLCDRNLWLRTVGGETQYVITTIYFLVTHISELQVTVGLEVEWVVPSGFTSIEVMYYTSTFPGNFSSHGVVTELPRSGQTFTFSNENSVQVQNLMLNLPGKRLFRVDLTFFLQSVIFQSK